MTSRCILFADVVGSTVLYEKLGDAEGKYAVDRCLKRVRLALDHFSGRFIKATGDGVLADFADAAAALAAACEMQQRVHDLPPVAGYSLSLRIGIHSGPVIEEGGDVFGDAVNIASRLADLARASQIIASAAVVQNLPALTRQSARALPALNLKGKREPIAAFDVQWSESVDLTVVAQRTLPSQGDAPPARLLLNHMNELREMTAAAPPLSIGRDKICDLVVKDRMASRQHARIERSGEHFVLVDLSTNGTWLCHDGEAPQILRRATAPLRGRGSISLGHPPEADSPLITFVGE